MGGHRCEAGTRRISSIEAELAGAAIVTETMMSRPNYQRRSDRFLTELIEADFEIAFNLVDMAEEQFHEGDRAIASRALHDADEVWLDIQRRLYAMGREKGQPFDPLVGELNRAIALAKSHTS